MKVRVAEVVSEGGKVKPAGSRWSNSAKRCVVASSLKLLYGADYEIDRWECLVCRRSLRFQMMALMLLFSSFN